MVRKELAPIHAYSFPLEEYHHYRTQKAGDALFMVAADTASHARALETAIMSRGCEGYCVALVPEGDGSDRLQRAAAHVRVSCRHGTRRARSRGAQTGRVT